jgi:hypothetical protein
VGDAGGDVAADLLVGRLLEMRLVIEIISAAFDSCRPAVVVDDHGMHGGLAEPERQLFIEAVQAPDVGEDHDPRAHWQLWSLRRRRRKMASAGRAAGIEQCLMGTWVTPLRHRVGLGSDGRPKSGR